MKAIINTKLVMADGIIWDGDIQEEDYAQLIESFGDMVRIW